MPGYTYRAKKYFSPSNLLTLHKAQIRSSLEYCSHIWGVAATTALSMLDAVQRRAIRLIAVLWCKASPSGTDTEKVLGSVGVEVNGERLKKVISELNGKNIEELISEGRKKLWSMPVGHAVQAAAAGGAAVAAEERQEAKKEEERKEKKEESDDNMGFGLSD
nr:unnamed protein product [Callosobruchus chinensis]